MQKPIATEDALKATISAHLDAQAQDISLSQRMRLDEARAAALSHARAPIRAKAWFGLRASAVLGASAAVLFAVGVQIWGSVERQADQEALLSMWEVAAPLESSDTLSPMDAAILADDDDAQVLDNLEFYAWLAEQQRSSAQSGS